MSIRSKKIGDWTEGELGRFVQQALHTSAPSLPPSMSLETVTATKLLTAADELRLSPQAIAYLKRVLGLP